MNGQGRVTDWEAVGDETWVERETVPSFEFCVPRTERRDAAEHRERILAVAKALFAGRGVDHVSMHQIAMAAGVGQGTLYRRYAHKGELCMALLGDSMVRLHDSVRAHLDADLPSTPALSQLEYVLEQLVAFDEEITQLVGNVVEAACGAPRTHMFHNPFFRWASDTLSTLLRRAIDRGEIDPLDVAYTTDAILTSLTPDIYLVQRRERGFTPERITQALHRLYIEGLRTRTA